ncbi:MAG: 2-oxo acid dehydrogenase subunit E2 [Lactobacillaceae bacterium]|jgi:pyruvate dehydrogenase E2 component (dihydrolipoamide acetyltransferase)|nr:2-oxo acid dehydrogenase subunit E2 [Lactobacillaceae bacterium]
MTEIFNMPDIGEGMAEGEISSWLIKVGDVVKAEDEIAEVQNDKLLQEIMSPYSGTVTKLFVEAGTTVSVGEPLVEFDGEGASAPAATPVATTQAAPTPVPMPAPAAVPEAPTPTPVATSPAPSVGGRVLAMPSVRHAARQAGIDLATVTPTGRHGHITLADVQTAQQTGTVPTPAATPAQPSVATASTPVAPTPVPATPVIAPEVKEGRVKMTPVRKAIAKAMEHQNTTIPAVTNLDSVEVSKLMVHRNNFKDQAADQGIKLTYLAYATKALALVAKKFPEVNASLDLDTQEVVYHDTVNVGIAVNAPAGLFVPVVAHAETKSILTIAKEIEALASAVRDGSIQATQMQGSTITISNLGSAQGAWFTPIINGQEVAILGLGSIKQEPIVDADGQLAVGNNMKLSLTYDHRLIDGMLGQGALNYLKQLLADPAFMLMEV